jgi:hypothetical protein
MHTAFAPTFVLLVEGGSELMEHTFSHIPTIVLIDHRKTVASLYYQNLYTVLAAHRSTFYPLPEVFPQRSGCPLALAPILHVASLRHVRQAYCAINGQRSHLKIAELLHLDPMRVRQALSFLCVHGSAELYDGNGQRAHRYTLALEQGLSALLREYGSLLTDQILSRLYHQNGHIRALYHYFDKEHNQTALFFQRFFSLMVLLPHARQLLKELALLGDAAKKLHFSAQDFLDIGEVLFFVCKEFSAEKWTPAFAESLRNNYIFCSDVVRYFSTEK